jgi:class 3 adenylate cyclase
MDERTQLEQAIKLQESLRGIVDDSIINAAITALRRQIDSLQKAQPAQAERKQATILFANVTGYNAISAVMDAEDVNEFMNALWRRLDALIVAQGGYIDKHMGDSVMAVWGAHATREDDPERAILSALAMQREFSSGRFISALPLDELPAAARSAINAAAISLRVGIHTGPVLLGRLGTTGEFTAIGDTVNTAKRLESAAPVGGVLISHDTFRHVRGVFNVTALAPVAAKGKAEPLQVYLVRSAKPRAFRQPARGVQGIETHMVGRQAEMDLLHAAVHRMVEESKGCLMLVTGEGRGQITLVVRIPELAGLAAYPVRFFYQGRPPGDPGPALCPAARPAGRSFQHSGR